MKTRLALIACIGLLCAGAASAQMPSFPPDWQSTKIIQTVEPLFPYQLQQESITRGEARVVINVDADGKLSEWLVIGYTMPEFADAAVRALKQWKFEPARLHGEPVGTTVELIFHFETQGTLVVNQTVTDAITARLLQLMAGSYVYKPCSLKELDRIPTPIYTVSPAYPRELAEKGARGTVVVDFYIDETGAVRMPSGSMQEDERLSGLAIAALRQWKFEPPTRNGKPVLVAAQQVFSFGAAAGK